MHSDNGTKNNVELAQFSQPQGKSAAVTSSSTDEEKMNETSVKSFFSDANKNSVLTDSTSGNADADTGATAKKLEGPDINFDKLKALNKKMMEYQVKMQKFSAINPQKISREDIKEIIRISKELAADVPELKSVDYDLMLSIFDKTKMLEALQSEFSKKGASSLDNSKSDINFDMQKFKDISADLDKDIKNFSSQQLNAVNRINQNSTLSQLK